MTRRQAVVLAGGLGRRMLPRTASIPQALIPVGGRPFVAWLLDRIASSGFDEAVLLVGHLGDQVRDFVTRHHPRSLGVRLVDEGGQLLGTGGALARAARLGLLDAEILVTYGDSYLPFDYAAPIDALRARDEVDGVMAVFRNEGRWDASNVEVSARGDRVLRYEKGGHDPRLDCIDYGATALRTSCLRTFAARERFGLDQVQHRLAASGRLGAHVAQHRFFEVGSEAGLADLEAHLDSERTP